MTPAPSPSPTGDGQYQAFSGETPVTIAGYTEDAMEPFVSPDGQFLFINNSNADPARTDLFVASRQTDTAFALQGPLGGANSATLDAVASMDDAARFYFISLRDYDTALETIFTGTFANGAVSAVKLVQGVSVNQRGRLNFDAEISPDGNSLWFADGSFSGRPLPDTAAIVVATRQGQGFVRAVNSAATLAAVNAVGLNYAPAISRDGLELFFTRIANPANPAPEIYRAARATTSAAFGTPQKVAGITGYVEAPALSADGRKLYYHKRVNGRFVIYLVRR
ncbi:MAG: hypothetical protein ACKO1O_08945 [Erythrobacter sp.]